MRLGVLDVGSNTVHFVVVDAHRGGHPTPMNDSKTRLRLIEYLDDDNNISKTGIARLIDAVNEAAELAEATKCREVMALANDFKNSNLIFYSNHFYKIKILYFFIFLS